MKYLIGFVFGFLLTIGLIYGFESCSAQSEVFLKSVPANDVRSDYANASNRDGLAAILPSPTRTNGEYILYFDLGFWLPANKPLTVNVYGTILGGSNVLL